MGEGCSAGVENKLKNKVKIQNFPPQNEYKTQNDAPAASNFSETGSTNMYISKIWGNKAYPIPDTSIYWSVEHICKTNDILVHAAWVHVMQV